MTTQLDSPTNESRFAMNSSVARPIRSEALVTSAPVRAEVELDGETKLLELLVHTSLRLRIRGADLETATGLVGRELDLVALLAASGPTSVKSLVADLGLPRSTMTAIVDRLQERGLVTRHPNPQDRRSVILESTETANAALSRYYDGMRAFADQIKKVLPEAEQAEFVRLVGKLASTL